MLSQKTKHTFLHTWISATAEVQVLLSESQTYLMWGLVQGGKIPVVSALNEVTVKIVRSHGISRAAKEMALA